MVARAKAGREGKVRAKGREGLSLASSSVPNLAALALAGVILAAKVVVFAIGAWALLAVLFMATSWVVVTLGAALGLRETSEAVEALVLGFCPGVFAAVSLAWVWVVSVKALWRGLVVGGWRAFRERMAA